MTVASFHANRAVLIGPTYFYKTDIASIQKYYIAVANDYREQKLHILEHD